MEKITKFSNFDVFIIVKELDKILTNGRVNNVYQIDDLIILKINTLSNETKNLIIKNDSRINITNYDYPIPKFPSQYILSLRKFLRNRKILKIYQYNFDRIIVFELTDITGVPWNFIIELFNKGNFILLDDNNFIKVAKSYKKFKDRDVLPNKKYEFPKIKGNNFLNIDKDDFNKIIINSQEEIIRIIARNVNISGLYSEEVCFRANLDKNRIGQSLNEIERDLLFKALKSLRNQLMFGDINAQIVKNDDGEELIFIPFKLEILKNYQSQDYKSFNEAVDNYFSKLDYQQLEKPKEKKIHQEINKFEKVLKSQEEYLDELRKKKENYYRYGDYIYNNFHSLQKLLNVILDAKSKGYNWEDINTKLLTAKKNNYEDLKSFIRIVPSTRQLVIRINSDEILIDLSKSIGENANRIYEKGKRVDKKSNGTLQAIQKTKEILDKLQRKKENEIQEISQLIKKPKKKWYERFRWFYTSDGFLVIGGRDASSNEIIYKKHIEPNDLVFHTNFPGSPLAIIKNPNNETISETSKRETADFVASYSRAWKENWGVVDIFYITPDQISKTPPSGEFLPKGSFMISGKKNIIKDAKTELAIKLEFVELKQDSTDESIILYPMLKYGPPKAIKTQNRDYITLKPSKSGESKGKMAKKIKDFFYKSYEEELKKWINLLSLDEIIMIIPSGKAILIEPR